MEFSLDLLYTYPVMKIYPKFPHMLNIYMSHIYEYMCHIYFTCITLQLSMSSAEAGASVALSITTDEQLQY